VSSWAESPTPDQARIDGLLAQLTLEEKVALTAGADLWHTPAIERLGISTLRMTDGPAGARGTEYAGGPPSACLPCGTALAATWDVHLIEDLAHHLAFETKAKGAHMLLAPTVNIHRHPLAGRSFECYSEDPVLTARIATAYVRGLQDEGVAACIKHFVANDSEHERFTISSEVPERALREIYLRPFELVIADVNPWAVMAAYNKVHGTWCSEHPRLLTTVLRDEWGYDGLVISDWWATHTTVEAMNAGLDLEMPGPTLHRGDALAVAVRAGEVTEATIDAAVRRLLVAMARTGALDAPPGEERSADSATRREMVRDAARAAIVLLRNDPVDDSPLLPLDAGAIRSLAVVGPNADAANVLGGGSAIVTPPYVVTVLEGLRARFPGMEIRHEPGCTVTDYPTAFDARWCIRPDGEPGLVASYVAGDDPDGPAVVTQDLTRPVLLWSGGPRPGLPEGPWSLRVESRLAVPSSGEHVLQLTALGRFRLRVDGDTVVDGWDDGRAEQVRRVEGSITLESGRTYALRIDLVPLATEQRHGLELRCVPPQAPDALERAVAAARASDVAIVVVGTNADTETEGKDRRDFALPGRQAELVEAVVAANPRTAVLVNAGAPVDLACAARVPALAQTWFLGQETGNAIADVLAGEVDASGRLPTTLPRSLADTPAFEHYPGEGGEVRYEEGVLVGYRWYEAKGIDPLFAFGHGCSYTTFAFGELDVAVEPDGLVVTVPVTNTGSRAGSEVVQVYAADLEASVERPPKELVAFAKVHLEPGATEVVCCRVDRGLLAFWDVDGSCWKVEPGAFELLVGASSADIRRRVTVDVH